MTRSSSTAVKPGRDATQKLSDLDEMRRQAADYRKQFEKAWYVNLAFFQGEQWWSFALGKFGRPRLEKYRVLFTDNKVQPAILSEVAKMTKQTPVWDAVPGSPDEDAVSDALLAGRVLEGKWADLKCQAHLERAAMWAQITGTVFWKLTWDPLASGTGAEVAINPDTDEPVVNPKTGQLVKRDDELAEFAEASGVQLKWQNVGEGDVAINVRSPFDMLIDPLAGDAGLDSARWVIEEAVRAPEEVQERFGLAEAPEPDASPSPGLIEARMPGQHADGKKVGVRVWELWERPTPTYPKGRHVVWCDNHILAWEDNPTKDHGLPYAMYVARWIPGRFYGMALADSLVPLNRELNKTRSQVRENMARVGNPPMLRARSDQGSPWQGLPGEVLWVDEYAGTPNGPAEPKFMQVPNLPGYVVQEPALIEASIDRAAHQSEVSRGQVPAGVTAASAIQLLQEADQTIIAMDARRFEQFVSETGRMILDLISEHYRTERLISIAGKDDTWDVLAFRAGQWANDVPTVMVKAGSMIPRSPSARQAQMDYILSLMIQHGYPIDPVSMGEFLRDYEVGGLERLVGAFSDDARQIAAENQQLEDLSQPPPPVNPWDNHTAHKRGHEKKMKSRAWQFLPQEAKDRDIAHWQEHDAAEQAQQMQQIQMQMMGQAGNAEIGRQAPQPNAKPSSADEARQTAGLQGGRAPEAPRVAA